jgi:glycerol-3-phosphate dehydrogenase
MLLLGVTDEVFEGDPSRALPTKESIRELRKRLAPFLAAELLADERVLSVSAGVRVLPRGRGATRDAPREQVIETSPSGMVSVGGGKLTTHRLIALEALKRLPAGVRLRRSATAPAPLPRAGPAPARLLGVEPSTAAHLRSIYGCRASQVVACARDDPNWLEPIHKDGPDVWAQARFAVDEEWATTADDVLRRRTTVAPRGLDGIDVRNELCGRLALRVA